MPHPTRQAIVRWAAAVLLTLVVVYPLSLGPFIYLNSTAIFSEEDTPATQIIDFFYAPAVDLTDVSDTYRAYITWWAEQAAMKYVREQTVTCATGAGDGSCREGMK